MNWWARALAVASIVGEASILPAQSFVRCWGEVVSDSEVASMAAAEVVAGDVTVTVRLIDGRVFTRGFGVSWWMSPNPPAPPAGAHYVQVDGAAHSLGLLSDGSVLRWGALSGLGQTIPPMPMFPSGTSVVEIASGGTFDVVRLSDGSLRAWGGYWPNVGQWNAPVLAPGLSFVQVAAGYRHGLALVSDGTLRGWGDSSFNQLTPPTLPTGMTWLQVCAGLDHSVALRSDGEVFAWGRNDFGQATVPALPAGMQFVSIGVGAMHSMALRSDGQLIAFGRNDNGQCLVPALPAGLSWVSFDGGAEHSVGLLSNGQVRTWGRDRYFMGDVPGLPQGRRYRHFVCGGLAAVAVMNDGNLHAWGDSSTGMTVPPTIGSASFVEVDASVWGAAGVLDDGTIRVWGPNTFGQHAVPPLPSGLTYTSVAMGTAHVVGLRSDGTAIAWGDNTNGQLQIPTLPSGVTYTAISAYERATLFLRSDGDLVASGLSSHAQFAAAAPALPPGVAWRSIDLGRDEAAGISTDGALHIWGPGQQGTPLAPPGVYWVEVACNASGVIARRSDGQVEVFDPVTFFNVTPPPLLPGRSYVQVSAGHQNYAGLVGAKSSYVTFASGCSGSMSTSQLVPLDTPQIGESFEVSVSRLPVDIAFVGYSQSVLPVPLSLTPYGLIGCHAHIVFDGLLGVVGSAGRATWTWDVPDDPALLGAQFVNQAVVLDPGVGVGVVMSDAASGVIGGTWN